MNGYLLDANVALIAGVRSDSLSRAVRRAIQRGPCWLSVVSYWEVVLKSTKGKLNVGETERWWRDSLELLAARPLPLTAEHVSLISHLPRIHEDPFDRALIAQAMTDELTLVTTDEHIPMYASVRCRVVR